MRRSLGAALAIAPTGLPACAAEAPSSLNPQGPASSRIEGLWWFMFGISAAGRCRRVSIYIEPLSALAAH